MSERPTVEIPTIEAVDAELAWLVERTKFLRHTRRSLANLATRYPLFHGANGVPLAPDTTKETTES